MSSLSTLETLFPKELMGCIIGEKGVKITEVREKNSVKIQNNKDVIKGGFREIRIDGEWCNVWNAFCELIKSVNEAIEENRVTAGQGIDNEQKFTVQIKVPINIAGSIIGKGGANLNEWRGRWTDGEFNVDNDPDDNMFRYLRVRGAPYTLCEASVAIADVIEAALQNPRNQRNSARGGGGNGQGGMMGGMGGSKRGGDMMFDDDFNGQKRRRMAGGGGMQQGNMGMGNQGMMGNMGMGNMGGNYGQNNNVMNSLETTTQIILEEHLIGKVIGQGGAVIKNIRSASNCSITTDRTGERGDGRREIQVTGSLPQLQIALGMIQSAVINGNGGNM